MTMTANNTADLLTADHAAKIAARAYQLWVSEGQPHGRAIDHWLQAEAELRVQYAPEAISANTKSSTPKPVLSKTK